MVEKWKDAPCKTMVCTQIFCHPNDHVVLQTPKKKMTMTPHDTLRFLNNNNNNNKNNKNKIHLSSLIHSFFVNWGVFRSKVHLNLIVKKFGRFLVKASWTRFCHLCCFFSGGMGGVWTLEWSWMVNQGCLTCVFGEKGAGNKVYHLNLSKRVKWVI